MVLFSIFDGQKKLANRLALKIVSDASVSRGVVTLTDVVGNE